MILKRIAAENFRNIKKAELEFCPGLNIFYGDNAQGKTNMLEALSVCLGRSFRRARPQSFKPFGEAASVDASGGSGTRLTLSYEPDALPGRENTVCYRLSGIKADADINGVPLKSAADLYGELKHVVFVPEHLSLVKGAPELRRFYIDNIAVMQSRAHKRAAADYSAALKQLNALNGELMSGRACYSSHDTAGVWNDILIRQGINLTYGRLKYFEMLREHAIRLYDELTIGKEALDIIYRSDVFGDISGASPDFSDKDGLYQMYADKLRAQEYSRHDFRIKAGAHRDDIIFTINGVNAREFGSQGQVKSLSLILKLAEAEIIRSYNNENPVILLDEVLGELDGTRRDFITNRLGKAQVFITSCDYRDFENTGDLRVWSVKDGGFYPYRR